MISSRIKEYATQGVVVFTPAFIGEYLPFLRRQLQNLRENEKSVRPWHFWELHNPWGRAAGIYDSWKFLELCQSKELLSLVAPLIGENIILYDSQFSPDLNEQRQTGAIWISDCLRCPVKPLAGIVARVPFSSVENEDAFFAYQPVAGGKTTPSRRIKIKPGQIVCHDIRLKYRVHSEKNRMRPTEYLIRYFPATSLYLRDPALKAHRALTERYPLLNYAQMPLWLAHGEDKADNDFVTGFQVKAGRWTEA